MKRTMLLFGVVLLLAGSWIGCGPDGSTCVNNADCAARGPGWACVADSAGNRRCSPQAPGLVCKDDSGCKNGQLCLNGRCQDVPGCVCKVDGDCPAQQKCSGCKCFPVGSGTCQTNDDCGKTALCLNGKCISKPKCGSDAQCNLDEVCLQGVCQPGPVCQTDAGCGAGQECIRGRCSRKPLRGCQSDFDCAKPTPICDPSTGKCIACRADSDCPPNAFCRGGSCATRPCGCRSDADCPVGSRCSECRCINEGMGGKAGTPCSSANDCAPSHLCLQTSTGKSYCFQDCTRQPRSCAANPDGRTTCLEISRDAQGNPISLCLKVLKVGEKCGDAGVTQSICDPNQGLSCRPDIGTCATQGSVVRKKAGESCDGQSVICDRSLKLFCDVRSGVCKSASRTAKEGEICDTNGQQGGGSIPCDVGFTCIQFDQNGNNRCIKICDPKQANSCAHNPKLNCLPLLSNGQGICLNYCKQDSDCVGLPNFQCRDLQGTGQICFPPTPTGPIPYGGRCGTPVNTRGCNTDSAKGGDPNFFCLSAQQGVDGYCSRICTNDNKCPDYKNKAGKSIASSCVEIQRGSKACLFFCGQPGQICPDGLTCQNVGGGQQICLAQ